MAFRAEAQPDGRTTLGLVWPSSVVEPALGYPDLGVLVLADGSLAEPWLRRPDPVPGAVPTIGGSGVAGADAARADA